MFHHILVPTDGSTLSDIAVKKAVLLAKDFKVNLTFFFAEPDEAASLLYGDASLLQAIDPQALVNKINRHVQTVLGKAKECAADEGVSCNVASAVSNEPFEAIIEAAEKYQCDLILMASHGRRGVKGLILGSQTQKVLIHSKIPVLVYR